MQLLLIQQQPRVQSVGAGNPLVGGHRNVAVEGWEVMAQPGVMAQGDGRDDGLRLGEEGRELLRS